MKGNGEGYSKIRFPVSRLATMDIGAVGLSKHHVKALLEVDVTIARAKILEMQNRGSAISFNGWLIKCIGHAVNEHKLLHGILAGKREAVIFENIDITIMVEREISDQLIPLPYLIRNTQSKSIIDISSEIKGVKEAKTKDQESFVLGEGNSNFLLKHYHRIPAFLRRFSWRQILRNPWLVKKNMGTVMVTALGSAGRIKGWLVPVSIHPLCIAVGSIIKKPGVVNNQIVPRDFLYLTAMVDHDVVDGAPAVRALTFLIELLESGYGLSGTS